MGSGDILEEITMIDAFETSGTSPSTDEHESIPLGLIPTQFNRPLPRKPPVKRAFSGMVGLPPEPEDLQKPVPSTSDSQEVRTTAEIVGEVLDRVNRTYSKRDAKTALRIALAET